MGNIVHAKLFCKFYLKKFSYLKTLKYIYSKIYSYNKPIHTFLFYNPFLMKLFKTPVKHFILIFQIYIGIHYKSRNLTKGIFRVLSDKWNKMATEHSNTSTILQETIIAKIILYHS